MCIDIDKLASTLWHIVYIHLPRLWNGKVLFLHYILISLLVIVFKWFGTCHHVLCKFQDNIRSIKTEHAMGGVGPFGFLSSVIEVITHNAPKLKWFWNLCGRRPGGCDKEQARGSPVCTYSSWCNIRSAAKRWQCIVDIQIRLEYTHLISGQYSWVCGKTCVILTHDVTSRSFYNLQRNRVVINFINIIC